MGRSLRFRVYVQQLVALLRLAFASAPCLPLNLATARNSLVHSSIGTPSLSLRLLVDIRFQVLFHSPPGVLFTFPSRYFSTIGHQGVFRLGRWSSLLQTGFLVSRPTLDTDALSHISLTGLSPSSVLLPSRLQIYSIVTSSVLNPE